MNWPLSNCGFTNKCFSLLRRQRTISNLLFKNKSQNEIQHLRKNQTTSEIVEVDFFYDKHGFENPGFTHMHIHNIVFDIHIFSMNRCKWMKKSQLQQKIGPAKAKGKCNNWLLQANVTTDFYIKLHIIGPMYSGI